MTEWTHIFDRRGLQSDLARQLHVTRQAVNAWKKNAYVPKEHATRFEELTGVPREVSCSDFSWAKPKRSTKQKAEA